MNFSDLVALAWSNQKAHKLRFFLTLLGLVMGVATLITVMTLVQGANLYVRDKIANLGINVFEVSKTPIVPTDFDEVIRALRYKDITSGDMLYLRDRCRYCGAIGAQVQTPVHVRYRDTELSDVALFGQTANMAQIGTRTIERGRFFTPSEEERSAPVCLLGYTAAEQLFGPIDPIDRFVRVGSQELRVLAIMERIGSVLGQDQDNYVIIPLPLYLKMQGQHHSLRLHVRTANELAFVEAQDEVKVHLRARRHVSMGAKDDFYIGTPDTYMELWRSISSAFFMVFVMISSIAAVVGGIVIMNIMLVAVTERTKEIGIRRACGARRIDILRQFLAEAVLVCMVGGFIGVGIGFSAASMLKRFTAFPASVQLWVAVLGVAFASLIGLFFGIYPASRAARLDPILALRSE